MRLRYSISIAVVVALSLTTAVAFIYVHREGERRLDREQRALSTQLDSAATAITDKTAGRLEDVAASIESEGGYSKPKFRHMAKRLVDDRSVFGVGFNQRVKASERKGWERETGSLVLVPGKDGTVNVVAPKREDSYVVIDAVSRGRIGPQVRGVDVMFDPRRREAIQSAIDSGKPRIAAQTALLANGGKGTFFYVPVYDVKLPTKTVAQRRKAATGVVAGVIRTKDLASQIGSLVGTGRDYTIRDGKDIVGGAAAQLKEPIDATTSVFGREWTHAAGRGTKGFRETGIPIATVGALLTLMVAIVLGETYRRERYAQQVVDLRTAELKTKTEELLAKVHFEDALMSGMSDAVVACDANGKFVFANDAAYEIHGMPPGAISPTRFDEARRLLREDGITPLPTEEAPLQIALRDGETNDHEVTFERVDGEIRVGRGSAHRMVGDDGTVLGAVVVFRDVTDEKAAEQRLAAAARYFDITRDLVVTTDFAGQIRQINGSWQTVLGWTESDLTGANFNDLVHPQDADETLKASKRLAAGAAIVEFRNRYRTMSGEFRWLEWSAVSDPELKVVYGSARDITDRVELERELTREQERLTRAQEIAHLGHFECDLKGGAGTWSDEQLRLFGLSPDAPAPSVDEWLGMVIQDDRDSMREFLAEAAGAPGEYEREYSIKRADGEFAVLAIRAMSSRESGKPMLTGTTLDITERKRLEEQLSYLADHDELTGLLNRRAFERDLTAHLARSERYGTEGALLIIDIDHLKQVNDFLGHAAGDELIVDVARAMRERLRTSDHIGRLGGDEFAILLPKADRVTALATAEALLERISHRTVRISDEGVARMTASIGIAEFGLLDELTTETAMVAADIAMYDAKQSGRNRCRIFKPVRTKPLQNEPPASDPAKR